MTLSVAKLAVLWMMRIALSLLPAGTVQADAARLHLLVDKSTEMPFARVHGEHAAEGIYVDIGRLLAERLNRRLEVSVTPRKRIGPMLESGRGDLACALLPEWLHASVEWTEAFMPHVGVVVTLQSARKPIKVEDLAHRPIGTVRGFAYPELEAALGDKLVRDDAPTAGSVLQKLDRGRTQHAAINLQFLHYQRRQGLQHKPLHPYLFTGGYLTRCAVSKLGDVKASDVDSAVKSLIRDGSIRRVLAKYE